jgi:tetratricopeptide (TPR) repeat protein
MRGSKLLGVASVIAIAIAAPSMSAPSANVRAESVARAEDGPERSVDQSAIDAYRRGDLDSARSLWMSAIDPEAGDGAGASSETDATRATSETNATRATSETNATRATSETNAAREPNATNATRATSADAAREELSPADRARTLYNLGNVAYRQKRVLESVGWYTAALRLSPRDPDIWWNLEHARSEAKLEPADRGDLSATLRRLVSSLTLSESERLVLAALAAWAVVLGVEALRGGRTWRRLSLAGALCVLLSLAPWIFNLSRAAHHPVLAIQEGKLEVRSEPRQAAPVIADVSAGDELERLDALPDWTKVELTNGAQGWARKSSLFVLDR